MAQIARFTAFCLNRDVRKSFLQIVLCFLLIPTFLLSCTTSENGAEDESVEGELNSELDDMSGVSDDSVAEGDAGTGDVDDIEDGASGDATADAGDGGEDDDFFAEDASQPAESQDLAEKDLQQELEKGDAPPADASAMTEEPPIEPAPVAGNSGPAATSSAVTSKETPISAPDGFEAVAPPSIKTPNEDLGISDPLIAEVDPPLPGEKVAKDAVPVSKIRKEPFGSKAGRLMNAIYIARPGDDGGTISQKLFDKDMKAMLEEDNEDMRRGVNVGDKIYYNSPNRPDDKKEMLTYYEDKKLPAQYYITKDNDNIQKIGREVLGYDDAWKEIWATNESLQTQAMLPAGLKIRYWSGNEMAEPPPEAPIMAAVDPVDTTSGGSTPAATVSPEPETLPDLTEASTEDPGLPPTDATPMPAEIATSAPDAAPPTLAKEGGDSLLTIAGVAIIGLAVLTLVAIQIKNRKRDDGSIPPSLEFTKV